jgi:hypothetical protein
MQCSTCRIDFLRDSVESIEQRFYDRSMKAYLDAQKAGGVKE